MALEKRYHLLIPTEGLILELVGARGRNRPVRDAGDAEILAVNCNGWAFESEENLVEFADDYLKKNPMAKLQKFSVMEVFMTVPSPMQRQKWNADANEFALIEARPAAER